MKTAGYAGKNAKKNGRRSLDAMLSRRIPPGTHMLRAPNVAELYTDDNIHRYKQNRTFSIIKPNTGAGCSEEATGPWREVPQ